MENKIDKIITLEDNSKYMIIDQGNYNGKCYFLTCKIGDNDSLTESFSIMEETIQNGVNHVSTVTDETLLKALADYFKTRSEAQKN